MKIPLNFSQNFTFLAQSEGSNLSLIIFFVGKFLGGIVKTIILKKILIHSKFVGKEINWSEIYFIEPQCVRKSQKIIHCSIYNDSYKLAFRI